MKKTALLLALVFSFNLGMAQEADQSTPIGNDEIRLNTLWLIIGSLSVSIEHIVSNDGSFGIVAEKTFDDDNFRRNFTIAPYYRIYFSKKKASGFFFETNFTVYSEQANNYYYYGSAHSYSPPDVIDSEIGAGLGIAVGGKFLSHNGFVLDIYAGMGRALNDPKYIDNIFGSAGVSIGKRF